jgi:hypothetical protein
VAVGEDEFHRVDADGLDGVDVHLALADLQDFLAGAVPAHLRRGRVHAQVFDRHGKGLPVVEGDVDDARLLVQVDLGGAGGLVHPPILLSTAQDQP